MKWASGIGVGEPGAMGRCLRNLVQVHGGREVSHFSHPQPQPRHSAGGWRPLYGDESGRAGFPAMLMNLLAADPGAATPANR